VLAACCASLNPDLPTVVSATTFGGILSINIGPTGTDTPRQIQFMLRLNF